MAIVIEEEKKKSGNILAAFGWLVIIIIFLVAGYYLFLVKPPEVLVPPPAGFANIQTLSQIKVVPEDVLKMDSFHNLKSPIANISSSSLVISGRANPFLPVQ